MRANLTCLILALSLVGCGGGDGSGGGGGQGGPPGSSGSGPSGGAPSGGAPTTGPGGGAPAGDATTGGKQDWADAMGTATVSGTVKFEGDAPERKAIDQSADANCHAETPLEEKVVVSADGGLQNVFISIQSGLENYKFAKGTGSVSLNQEGCQYKPHAIGMIKGQTLTVKNSDETAHNVHPYPTKNVWDNKAQPAGSPDLEYVAKRDDAVFSIKCDMHAWMNCFVAVFPNQFFTVSDASGAFTLPKLPAGTYKVTAKHESLGSSSQTITIEDGGATTVDFSFKAK